MFLVSIRICEMIRRDQMITRMLKKQWAGIWAQVKGHLFRKRREKHPARAELQSARGSESGHSGKCPNAGGKPEWLSENSAERNKGMNIIRNRIVSEPNKGRLSLWRIWLLWGRSITSGKNDSKKYNVWKCLWAGGKKTCSIKRKRLTLVMVFKANLLRKPWTNVDVSQ